MKIQIEILDDLDPSAALSYVAQVIQQGRKSRGSYRDLYCYCTKFNNGDWKHPIAVTTSDTRKIDCFTVYQE